MTSALDEERLGALYAKARRAEDEGDIPTAASLFHECLAMDPDDHCGVSLRLAGHGLAAPDAAPPAYIATLFSQQARAFDHILVDRLGYDVPALARRAVRPHLRGPVRLLDLGCGTGLVGAAFADVASHTIGVDLAEGMLEEADARGCYDELYVAEAVNFLAEWDEAPFDLIVAADVWPYVGDLSAFVQGTARCLAGGGLVVTSTERGEHGWAVTPTQRFAHATAYATQALKEARFSVLVREPITVRFEEGVAVPGDIFVAKAKDAAANERRV